MIAWRTGVVRSVGRSWAGAQEFSVEVQGSTGPAAAEDPLPHGTLVRALAYPELVGTPAVGDRVCLTVSALVRGLGTGGYAFHGPYEHITVEGMEKTVELLCQLVQK